MTEPPETLNFAEHLFAINRGRAGKIAYVDDRGALSYGELEERVAPLRRGPARRSAFGARSACCCSCSTATSGRSPSSARSTPASSRSRSTRCSPSTTTPTCSAHSRAQAAIVSASLEPRLRKAMAAGGERGRARDRRRRAGDRSRRALRSTLRLARRAQRAARRAGRRRAATIPRFWLYSSGSTGRPKGTVHTHANAWWTAELYGKRVLGLTEDDVCFSAAKLFFAYGLGNALTFPLSVGATVVLMAERPTPDAVFKRWTGAATARRRQRRPAADGLLRRADRLRRHARVARAAGARRGRAAHVLVGRRGAAGRDRPALRAPLRLRHRRRHRLDRDAAHLPLEPARRRPLRHHRQAGRRATRSSCAARTAGRSPTARSATSSSRGRARR